MKVGVKLGLGFGSLLLLTLIVGILGISRLSNTTKGFTVEVKSANQMEIWADKIPFCIISARAERMSYFETKDPKHITLWYASISQGDSLCDLIIQNTKSDEAKNLAGEIKKSLALIVEDFNKITDRLKAADVKEPTFLGYVKIDTVIQELINGETGLLKATANAKDNTDKIVALESKIADESEADITGSAEKSKMFMIIFLVLSIIIGVAVTIFLTRMITIPLLMGVDMANKAASGDLTSRVDIKSSDEIGALAESLNKMSDSLRGATKNIIQISNTFTNSAETLSSSSNRMSSNADKISGETRAVASATEQVTSNMSTVAAAAEESSNVVSQIAAMSEEMSSTVKNVAEMARNTARNVHAMAGAGTDMSNAVNNIATAIEEMTAAIGEVSRSMSKANRISMDADTKAKNVTMKMEALTKASKEINKIVEMIKDITDQTNMLALNATIEAAGAGEAGKGFAVVAGEVKALAEQTGDATDEISNQIENIQRSISEAVTAIIEIGKIIEELAGINSTIASSLEEQTSTVNEIARTIAGTAGLARDVAGKAEESSTLVNDIARSTDEVAIAAGEVAKNVEEASNATKDIARSVTEAAVGANEISRGIHDISKAVNEIAMGALETSQFAKDIEKDAHKLKNVVSIYKVGEEKFDIGRIKTAHLSWRGKLESVIRGVTTMRPEDLGTHRDCEFGKWYHGEGQKFSSDPLYTEIGRHHEDVHSQIRRVVQLINDNKQSEAKSVLVDFEKSREKMFDALEKLYSA